MAARRQHQRIVKSTCWRGQVDSVGVLKGAQSVGTLESLWLNWPDALQAAQRQRRGRHWAPSEQHENLEPVLEDLGVCSLAREREEVKIQSAPTFGVLK